MTELPVAVTIVSHSPGGPKTVFYCLRAITRQQLYLV